MQRLQSKKILITGGTTGIGRTTAIALAKEGADVFIFGRHKKQLDEALSDIKTASGKEAFGTTADVANDADLIRVFSIIDSQFGKIDILINNAALGARSVLDHHEENLDYILKVNIEGYLRCSRYALDRMLPHKDGHIINIGSMSAEIKEADDDIYVATKSAINGFSESLRKKVNEMGVRVTLIEPGSVGTMMINETLIEKEIAEKEGFLLRADDIASAILFSITQPRNCNISIIQLKAINQRF